MRTHKDERRRTMVQIWMLAPLGPDTHGAGTCKTRSRNQRLNILLALPIMMLTMGRPREFGTNSPGRRELCENDEMYRRRLKDGRVTALFPQDIAKQLDRAGLHMIEDLRSKELVDIYCALPGTGPAGLREILEKVGRVERNSDLVSAHRKARSIMTSKGPRIDPGHNNG